MVHGVVVEVGVLVESYRGLVSVSGNDDNNHNDHGEGEKDGNENDITDDANVVFVRVM